MVAAYREQQETRGRRHAMRSDTEQDILADVRSGLTVTQIMAKYAVGRTTAYKWISKTSATPAPTRNAVPVEPAAQVAQVALVQAEPRDTVPVATGSTLLIGVIGGSAKIYRQLQRIEQETNIRLVWHIEKKESNTIFRTNVAVAVCLTLMCRHALFHLAKRKYSATDIPFITPKGMSVIDVLRALDASNIKYVKLSADELSAAAPGGHVIQQSAGTVASEHIVQKRLREWGWLPDEPTDLVNKLGPLLPGLTTSGMIRAKHIGGRWLHNRYDMERVLTEMETVAPHSAVVPVPPLPAKAPITSNNTVSKRWEADAVVHAAVQADKVVSLHTAGAAKEVQFFFDPGTRPSVPVFKPAVPVSVPVVESKLKRQFMVLVAKDSTMLEFRNTGVLLEDLNTTDSKDINAAVELACSGLAVDMSEIVVIVEVHSAGRATHRIHFEPIVLPAGV